MGAKSEHVSTLTLTFVACGDVSFMHSTVNFIISRTRQLCTSYSSHTGSQTYEYEFGNWYSIPATFLEAILQQSCKQNNEKLNIYTHRLLNKWTAHGRLVY